MAKRPTINLFFDVLSPYSWIGFESLTRYRTVWPIQLKLRPFSHKEVMKATGNRPQMLVPAKGIQMAKDLQYQRKYWGIPLKMPSDPVGTILNKGSLLSQHFLTAINEDAPEYLEPAARELWLRIWSRDEPIDAIDNLKEVAKKIGLPQAEKIISRCDDDKIKQKLTDTTQEAIASGWLKLNGMSLFRDEHPNDGILRESCTLLQRAFGSPWILLEVDGKTHSFWGSDRLPVIADFIGEEFLGHMRDKAPKYE